MQHPPRSHLFPSRLRERATEIDSWLDAALSFEPREGEVARPQILIEAMRYATLGGGKRFRPFLLIETAVLLGADARTALPAAAALECVHCYSLVHDDLPAMDDDDLRRGRPTVHKAYDEALAILAGDSLLTLAFDILSDRSAHPDPLVRARLVSGLARAAGCGGMAGGQVLDLAAQNTPMSISQTRRLQSMKTGALIRFAVDAGAEVAGAHADHRQRLSAFGALLGAAFQLGDDLLDATGDSASLGKKAGKDAAAGKATLVALKGVAWAQAELKRLIGEAEEKLTSFGDNAAPLIGAARFLATRTA